MTEKQFLKLLQKTKNPPELEFDELQSFSKAVDDYIDLSCKKKKMPDLEILNEIRKQMLAKGLFVEISEVLLNWAYVFKSKGDMQNYFYLAYQAFAAIFSAVFLPDMYEKLKAIRTEAKGMPQEVWFIVMDAFVSQIHLFKYEDAVAKYLRALEIIEESEKKESYAIGSMNVRQLINILKHNLFDSLLKLAVSEKQEDKKEAYIAMAGEILNEIENIYSIDEMSTMLSKAEYLVVSGNYRKAGELLNYIKTREDLEANYIPIYYLVWAELYWSVSKIKQTSDYLRKSLDSAVKTGSSVIERECINFTIFLLSSNTEEFSIFTFEGERVLKFLLSSLFSKDWYLGIDHSTRVGELSLKVAKAYSKLSGIEFDYGQVYTAGLLHDIGKLYVPWYVLNKPGKLLGLEWECIKFHPVYGAALSERLGMKNYMYSIAEHHERIDGSGYPYHKKDLSPLSQIIGISDVYEAATTKNRFYKKPKTMAEIMYELESQKEVKFDSLVVEALKAALLFESPTFANKQ